MNPAVPLLGQTNGSQTLHRAAVGVELAESMPSLVRVKKCKIAQKALHYHGNGLFGF